MADVCIHGNLRPQCEMCALHLENAIAKSALRVIHTWARVQIGFPDENVLDPQHVLDECRRGLGDG